MKLVPSQLATLLILHCDALLITVEFFDFFGTEGDLITLLNNEISQPSVAALCPDYELGTSDELRLF